MVVSVGQSRRRGWVEGLHGWVMDSWQTEGQWDRLMVTG